MKNPQNIILKNPTPFPRLVWSIIIEFLSYYDRCSLRQMCRWMATFKNRRPLLYWLRRNDPVTHCLDKDSRICILLKNGIRVNYPSLQNIRFVRAALYGNIFTGDYQIFKSNYVNTDRLLKKNYAHHVEKILNMRGTSDINLDYILYMKQPEKITNEMLCARTYVIHLHALMNNWQNICERCENILNPEAFRRNQLLYELVYKNKISVLNEVKRCISLMNELTIPYALIVEAINKRNYSAIELISLCTEEHALRRAFKTRNIKIIHIITKCSNRNFISSNLIRLLKNGHIGVIKFLCRMYVF